MRWTVFVIFAYGMLALQRGLGGLGHYTPELMLILLIYVGLSAPPAGAAWSALIIGLLSDLSLPLPVGAGAESVVILGPATLGCLVGGWAAYQLRGLVFRDSPLALAVMVLLIGILVHLVTVALLTARGLPMNPADTIHQWHAADELFRRFLRLLTTTVAALPLGLLLIWTDSLWRFQQPNIQTRRN